MPMTISIDYALKQDFSKACQEIGLRDRAANAYDRDAVDGINRGLCQFDEGDYLTREQSRDAHGTEAVVA